MDDFKRRPVNKLGQPQQNIQPQPVVIPQPNINAAPTPAQQGLAPAFVDFAQPVVSVDQTPHTPQPIADAKSPKPKKSKKKTIILAITSFVALLLVALVGVFVWYTAQLSPVDGSNTNKTLVTIKSGSSPTAIATTLKEEGLIRSQDAFLWYTRLEGVQNSLQAGSYRLSPSESTQEIVKHLVNGKVDSFDITFLPGETLAQSKKTLIAAGYSEQEVTTALNATYTSPLFEGKPTTADLEGYIYGDTYRFGSGATVESILEHVFEKYYQVIEANGLVAKFKANNLSLYEGITLASIVQRESIGGDEPQIAQVFYKRLSIDMQLGSDVTYQYIADKTGVPRDTNLDSPYNTRRYTGLPPGPIAVPGLNALNAVGSPAQGDYIYFLSGDDDITYFANTLEEHEANIVNHCKVKCQII